MGRIITRSDAAGGTAAATATRDWRACASRMDGAAPARSQAATILLNARAQARTIIMEAQATAQAVAAAERQHAWESGYHEGLAQGQREASATVQQLGTVVAGAAVAHDQSVRNMDDEVLALVMAVARAVVCREVQTAPDTILAVARVALEELSVTTSVLLRVHPHDRDVLEAHLPALGLAPSVHVAVVPDEAIAPGGCVVESGGGLVDGTIEGRLARIESLLREEIHAA